MLLANAKRPASIVFLFQPIENIVSFVKNQANMKPVSGESTSFNMVLNRPSAAIVFLAAATY